MIRAGGVYIVVFFLCVIIVRISSRKEAKRKEGKRQFLKKSEVTGPCYRWEKNNNAQLFFTFLLIVTPFTQDFVGVVCVCRFLTAARHYGTDFLIWCAYVAQHIIVFFFLVFFPSCLMNSIFFYQDLSLFVPSMIFLLIDVGSVPLFFFVDGGVL